MPSSEVGRERGLLDYHVSLAHPLVRALYILPLGFAGCLQKSYSPPRVHRLILVCIKTVFCTRQS